MSAKHPQFPSGQTVVTPVPSAFDIEMGNQDRGIIISNSITINGSSFSIKNDEIDPDELRRALLFWDKLIWPSTNGIYIGGGPDIEFLEDEGKIVRPHFQVNGDGAKGISMAFSETFQKLDQLHPGKWMVSNGVNSLRTHGNDFAQEQGVIMHMVNAIPVPRGNIPLEELLRFKEKRNAELLALRTVIDEFYQSWVNSQDQQHQLMLAISKVDQASADMIKVAQESRYPFSMSSWKINFNITLLDVSVLSAALLGLAPFDLGTASLLAGASKVSLGTGIGLRNSKTNSPFNYIASMEKDLN